MKYWVKGFLLRCTIIPDDDTLCLVKAARCNSLNKDFTGENMFI